LQNLVNTKNFLRRAHYFVRMTEFETPAQHFQGGLLAFGAPHADTFSPLEHSPILHTNHGPGILTHFQASPQLKFKARTATSATKSPKTPVGEHGGTVEVDMPRPRTIRRPPGFEHVKRRLTFEQVDELMEENKGFPWTPRSVGDFPFTVESVALQAEADSLEEILSRGENEISARVREKLFGN
tara:strand:- start:50 stop:601 length:552 start_codon:yes stop_codon:yes gene_type:complete